MTLFTAVGHCPDRDVETGIASRSTSGAVADLAEDEIRFGGRSMQSGILEGDRVGDCRGRMTVGMTGQTGYASEAVDPRDPSLQVRAVTLGALQRGDGKGGTVILIPTCWVFPRFVEAGSLVVL